MNEHDYALRDAAMAEFVDSYFKARPQLLRTRHEECLVEAGFKAAWKPDQTERAEKAEAELARLLASPNEIGLGKGEFVIWPVKINGVHGLAFVKTDDPKVVGTSHAEPEDGQIELGAGDSAIYFGNAESAMVLAERLQYVISLMTGSDAAPVPAVAAPAVPDGWNGWRDVAVHGYPEKPMECMFVLDGRTVHGAYLGGAFWFSNERVAIALWMPMPKPLSPDSHRALLQSTPSAPETNGERAAPAVGASMAAPAVPEPFMRLLSHAIGLSHGTDWNKGTAANHHRAALIQAMNDARALLQSATQSDKEV